MKVSPAGRFWALRPRLTARRLELACWLTGLVLAAALIAAMTSSDAGASSTTAAVGVAPDASAATYATALTDYQSRCIKRVIALTVYWPGLDVGKQIEHECLMRRVPAAVPEKPTWTSTACTLIAVWRPPAASARPTGCPN